MYVFICIPYLRLGGLEGRQALLIVGPALIGFSYRGWLSGDRVYNTTEYNRAFAPSQGGEGMTKRPILWFTICWVAGSAAAAGLDRLGAILALSAFVIAGSALIVLRLAPWRLVALCWLAYAAAAGERMWADSRNHTSLQDLREEAMSSFPPQAIPAAVTGKIISAVTVDGDRVQFRIAADTVSAADDIAPRQAGERMQVQLRLAEQPEQAVAAAWRRGDHVQLAGELTLPASATNFGGFDYRRYLNSQRIHWLFKVEGAAAVKAAPGPRWSAAALRGQIDALRAALGARMDKLYPDEQAGYMKGLVLGIRDDLDPERYLQYADLGLTHILAISGLHVGIFLYGLNLVLRQLRLARETAMTVMIAAIPCYVLLTGAEPSVVRAGMMAIIGLLAAKRQMLKDGLHLLAAAALLMLVFDPYLIENISFQMSFIVTGVLIIGVPPLRKALPQSRKAGPLLDSLVVSVVADLGSFPLTIYYFNQYNFISLPTNILLVPFISLVAMPAGACSLLLAMLWPTGGKWVAAVAEKANDLTYLATDFLQKSDALRMIWPSPPGWWMAVWYILLIAAFKLIAHRTNRRTLSTAAAFAGKDGQPAGPPTMPLGGMDDNATSPLQNLASAHQGSTSRASGSIAAGAMVMAAALLLLYAYEPDRFERSAQVAIIDIGQGDATLIRLPSGGWVLVDGGGTSQFRRPGTEWRMRRDPFEVGRKVLVPLLKKRGVKQIDMLVITHLDQDHVGGLKAVLQSIPVRRILWNGSLKPSGEMLETLQLALNRSIPIYAACAGQRWQMEREVSLQVLWPQSPQGESCTDSTKMVNAIDGAQSAETAIETVKDQNNRSVVFLIELYGKRLLMTGDIEAAAERGLIRSLARDTLLNEGLDYADGTRQESISLLKVAHHGSRTSTTDEWLNYWKPDAALISAGRFNHYGHPHPTVVERLDIRGIPVLRTDLDGEIQFRITADQMFQRTKLIR
ncbi:ComEC family competence protein [Paenibacillaceae bacterium]|nr:ComEC family competence protein [Paenibacillaceae bacterium]